MAFAVIESMSLGESFLISLVGFSIVFAALIILMFLIKLITAVSVALAGGNKIAASAPAPAAAPPVSPPAPASDMVPAKGSLGEIKLNDVDDKTAALVMAIVADELKAPLNELRFKSIRTKQGGR